LDWAFASLASSGCDNVRQTLKEDLTFLRPMLALVVTMFGNFWQRLASWQGLSNPGCDNVLTFLVEMWREREKE